MKMKVRMTTREAFIELINRRGIHHSLGVSQQTIANYRQYLKKGQLITQDTMEEMLRRGGFEVIQEKLWTLKTI